MSRDNDDSFDWSPKPKPTPKPVDDISQFIQKGKLTSEGQEHVSAFAVCELIRDPECLLDWSEVQEAFAAWKGKVSYRGFSLDRLDDDAEFESAILRRFNRNDLQAWDIESISEVDRARLRANTTESGVRARFRDRIGVESFDPDEDEADAKAQYLVQGMFVLQSVNMFVALPETLKSWLAFSVAIAVSKGVPALGRFDVIRARTLLLDWEVGTPEMKRRLRLLGAGPAISFKSHPTFKLGDESFWTELEKIRPEFVVIDSLSAGSGAEFGELDSRFAEPLGRAARFAEAHRCTFLFLHHSPKAASLSDTESLFRGTGAIRSKVDSAFYFRRLADGANGEARAEVIPVKARKGPKLDRFAVQITDERGVELFDVGAKTAPAAPVSDEDRVLRMIAAEPGVSGNRLSDELEMRRETVSSALDSLKKAGRIRQDGQGRTTGYSVVESFPESFPVERKGNDSGNDAQNE